MTRSARLFAFAVLALAAACASRGGSSAVQESGAPSVARSNPNLITQEEIASSSAANVYDLIQRLRPNFLRTRGAVHGAPTTENHLEAVQLVVYMNENRLGNSDQLRQIPLGDIREVRYFSASDATTKWGVGHSAGAIQVVSR
jgi:hypothetical protein